MALKKDKQKVLGEVFDDQRIKTFLDNTAPEGTNLDYYLLEKAYRGMKVENFTSFLGFFKDAGHDINATNPDGKTFLQVSNEHRCGEDYTAALRQAGAQ